MDSIKIALIEDHLLIRDAWKSLLSKRSHYSIVAETDNIDDAFSIISATRPDVILMDINLKGKNGAELISEICNKIAHPRIIVVSMNNEYSFVKKMFKLGIMGYVTKFSSQEDFINSIEQVYQGKKYMCEEIKNLFLNNTIHAERNDTENFSIRELDIIRFVSKGFGNKEIAQNLQISIKTVEGHKTKIYKKLGARSIAEIISYSKAKGLDF
ncbi:MAG: response regulator transcription factor [Bacteroidetes bacterium]|nr:response regulator transcription factor [Bacteroidota bacterium]